jgi:hypothetical protein
MRFELLADGPHPLFARGAVAGRSAHLDQFVRLQRTVDLRDHLVRESLVANDDDRAQRVGLRAQLAATGGAQWHWPSINRAFPLAFS